MKLLWFVILVSIGVQSFPRVYAEVDASICVRGLVRDFDFSNSDSRSKLDYLKSIDKETYEESKVRVEIVGSAFDNTFTGDDSYDQFNNKREKYLEKQHYVFDEATRVSHLREYIPDARAAIAYEAYKFCIENLAPQYPGLYNAVMETEAGATVFVYWHPPDGNTNTTISDSNLTGWYR